MRIPIMLLVIVAFAIFLAQLHADGLLTPLILMIIIGTALWAVIRSRASVQCWNQANASRHDDDGQEAYDLKREAYAAQLRQKAEAQAALPSGGTPLPSILATLDELPATLRRRSGSVFYTGAEAFSKKCDVYLLGLNPGGDPFTQVEDTITWSIAVFKARTDRWSAYVDESWQGAPPGQRGLQPRVRHLLDRLGLDPRLTPASNLVFARTRSESDLRSELTGLADVCWPVHHAVITELKTKVVVCFGQTAGSWVRKQVSADRLMDYYKERNARGWETRRIAPLMAWSSSPRRTPAGRTGATQMPIPPS